MSRRGVRLDGFIMDWRCLSRSYVLTGVFGEIELQTITLCRVGRQYRLMDDEGDALRRQAPRPLIYRTLVCVHGNPRLLLFI